MALTHDKDGKPITERVGVWSLVWRFPHKPRPEGFPEIALQIRVPLAKGQGAGQCPKDIDEAWEELSPYGYCVSWHLEAPPGRLLPLESKQRIRRRNLWKRLLAKSPMFIEQFYAEQVQAKPDYYGPFKKGEFADVEFVRTTMGNLRQLKQKEAA